MLNLDQDPLVLAEEYGLEVEPMYFLSGLTSDKRILLRQKIVTKLCEAQSQLPRGLKFKIWDGFRTTAVQQKLYSELYKKLEQENSEWNEKRLHKATQEFVSEPTKDPSFASPHNTGGAVDLTLIDDGGRGVLMGTPFDYFHEPAHTFYFEKAVIGSPEAEIHANRMVLYEALVPLGFHNLSDEWWHFSYGDRVWAEATNKPIIYPSAEIC